MAKTNKDRYIRMYGPLLDVLREMGGEGSAREVSRKVADIVLGHLPEERTRELKSGGNAAENEVAWARNNLKMAGFIDASKRGMWALTEAGWKKRFSLAEARALGKYGQILTDNVGVPGDIGRTQALEEEEPLVLGTDSEPPTRSLIEVLRQLAPSGFERLCQRLLREAGFAEVEVTGRSGDGGIDGNGVLQINELVSFRVLFQCKRYQGTVGSDQVRNFRGAMSGRTDKGIFITTGSFSADAQREAIRDGVPPIELVDAQKLVTLMERLQLGVRPRTVYDVDEAFFVPFQN